MGIEGVIYFYGAVCVSMIAFNLVYALLIHYSEPRMEKRTALLQKEINRHLDRIRQGEHLDPNCLRKMKRKLQHVRQLAACDQALYSMTADTGRAEGAAIEAPVLEEYLTQLEPVILDLAMVYRHRNTMQSAFFCYFLSRHMNPRHMPVQTLQEVLLSYMQKNSLYCRVNVLQALCSFGSAGYIFAAVRMQDQDGILLHEKILTEVLLTYTGDHEQLIFLFLDKLQTFTPHTQVALLNYIRFCCGGCCREIYSLMEEEGLDKEVRLAAIRYFGRYEYAPALDVLLRIAETEDPLQWEYVTVAMSALSRYHGPRVINALKRGLHSPNWYIRYSAAVSLEAQDVDYEDLFDVMAGKDRYAREMILYRLETRRLQEDKR